METQHDEPTWGAEIILPAPPSAPSYPRRQDEIVVKPPEPGLVVWNEEHSIRLAPDRAMILLDAMRAIPSWQETGTMIDQWIWSSRSPKLPAPKRVPTDLPSVLLLFDPQPHVKSESMVKEIHIFRSIPATPAQAQFVYDLLSTHEAALRALVKQQEEAWLKVLGEVQQSMIKGAQEDEARKVDLTSRPYPWRSEQYPQRWVCEVGQNRATIVIDPRWYFTFHCQMERPHQPIQESGPFIPFEDALAWSEQQLAKAAEEDAQAAIPKPPVHRLTPATLTKKHRARLAPFWISPADLEPSRVSYKVHVQLIHKHTSAKAYPMSFGEKWYYDKKYPSPADLKRRFLALYDCDIEDVSNGVFHINSSTTYLKKEHAVEAAQRLWGASGIAAQQREGTITWAEFGVKEVETGYTEIIGGVGEWFGGEQSREKFLAEQAFTLTLFYALDLEGWRANLGLSQAQMNDTELLKIMHERRANASAIPAAAREESRRWLSQQRVAALTTGRDRR